MRGRSWFFMALLMPFVVLLTGCGQKGKLYMPDAPAKAPVSVPTNPAAPTADDEGKEKNTTPAVPPTTDSSASSPLPSPSSSATKP
jgi:predicted small lipoprotein YifL